MAAATANSISIRQQPSSSRLSRPQLQFFSLVALACLASLGYNNIVRDAESVSLSFLPSSNNDENTMLLQELHRQLDTAFADAQQVSNAQFEDAQLNSALTSDSAQSTAVASTSTGISSTCTDFGITPEVVAKSRILGNTNRWHHVMNKMNDGEKIKVAILGGSVPGGSECAEGGNFRSNAKCAWPAHFANMVHEDENMPNVEVHNLSRAGVPSSAGLTQILGLKDYDFIIMQWTTNDDQLLTGMKGYEKYNKNEVQSKSNFETLIRTALGLPKKPAVIIFESLGIRVLGVPEPLAEIMHYSVATVYEIPVVSARNAFWRQKSFESSDWSNTGKSLHPKSIWHNRLACLMYENWIQESNSKLDMSNWLDPLDQSPVFGGETMNDCQKLYGASSFEETLEHAPSSIGQGWSYYADAPNKFGFISNTTDSILQFDIAHGGGDSAKNANTKLEVHYLRSYTPEWGSAQIEVNGGEPKVIDSHCDDHASQIDVMKIDLEISEEPYKVTVKNIGGKVKIVELLLYSCPPE